MDFESAIQLIATQLIANTNIAKVFGLGVDSFLTVILGSFIVGYICLTFYYKIYNNNELWTKLEFAEKVVVSSVIGLSSILVTLFVVTIFQLMLQLIPINKEFERTLAQLYYIAPFLYFIVFWKRTAKNNYSELEFIKRYVLISFSYIQILVIIFILIVLSFAKEWITIFLLLLLIAYYGYRYLRSV